MSRKRLTSSEMLHISGEWINSNTPAHAAILASNELAASLPRIQATHQELLAAAKPTTNNDPRLFEIIKKQFEIDQRHDELIRGIHGILTSTASLLDPDDAAPLITLRDQLLPDGLSSIQRSYSHEANQAAQLAARLTPELRNQIDKFTFGPKSKPHRLSTFVDEWIQIGEQLGQLDNEKARLASPSPQTTSANAQIVAARNKWLRTVHLFLAIADAAEIDPATERLLFSPLRSLEAKAARRGRTTSLSTDADTPDNASDPPGE